MERHDFQDSDLHDLQDPDPHHFQDTRPLKDFDFVLDPYPIQEKLYKGLKRVKTSHKNMTQLRLQR